MSCTGPHVTLQMVKNQPIFCKKIMAMFSEYKGKSIVSLWHDGCKVPAITKILTQKIYHKSLKKYIESGAIGKQ